MNNKTHLINIILNHIKNKSLINIIYDIYHTIPAISQDKINKYEKIKHYLIPVKYRKRTLFIHRFTSIIALITLDYILKALSLITNILRSFITTIKSNKIKFNTFIKILLYNITQDKTNYISPFMLELSYKRDNNFKRTKEFLNNIDTEEDKDNLYRLFTFIYLKPLNLPLEFIQPFYYIRRIIYYIFLISTLYYYVIPIPQIWLIHVGYDMMFIEPYKLLYFIWHETFTPKFLQLSKIEQYQDFITHRINTSNKWTGYCMEKGIKGINWKKYHIAETEKYINIYMNYKINLKTDYRL